MSDIASLWLLFIVGFLINCSITKTFLYCSWQCFRHCGVQWTGLDVGRNTHGHRGLDWIGLGQSASGLVGLDLAKWTHVQLCNVHLHDVPQQHHVSDKTTRTYY